MRVEARLPADCDLGVLDCGCDMVMCSCGNGEGRIRVEFIRRAAQRVGSIDLETGET